MYRKGRDNIRMENYSYFPKEKIKGDGNPLISLQMKDRANTKILQSASYYWRSVHK